MNKVRIAGAIASNTGVTLYLDTGKEINLPSSSWRTKQIMDEIAPKLARHKIVEVDLDSYSLHAAVEQKTGGFIRFFKDKLSALASIFKSEEPTVVVGDTKPDLSTIIKNAQDRVKDGANQTVTPAPAPDVPETKVVEPVGMVAVVNDKIIPAVDNLERHIEHAMKTGNTVGLERFMDRISKVIDKRSHSIEELMNFMQRGDLPIADDGSIIAYKVLQSRGSSFVDCHSKSVTQRLGSRVSMDEKLVDLNRRNECSTGLHIARRAYLGGFGGDIITLVKVAPEDVIAVPPGEPNKMRAAAYHIVAVLPQRVHDILRGNSPMTTDAEAARILADVIAGNHPPVIEEVRIGSAMGGNVTVTPVGQTPEPVEQRRFEPKMTIAKSDAPVVAKALDDPEAQSGVSITDINKTVREAASEAESAKERRNRVKREQRAAAKTASADKIQEAAMTGNMAAALSQAAAAPDPEPVKAAEPAKPVPGDLPEKHKQALQLRSEGKSNRQIEAELHICRKTLKKLFDKHPA